MSDSMFPPNVFDRLLKDRIIWLGSEVRDENANEIAAKLLLLAAEDPKKDIYLYINSPGGSITAGMAIYDTMQFVPNDIVTVGIGMAASMGQLLLTSWHQGQAVHHPERTSPLAPATRWFWWDVVGHPDAGTTHQRYEEAPRGNHRRSHGQDR
jgi:ATP-dependent Clp endopeptidase proteolytic subunit ClpP